MRSRDHVYHITARANRKEAFSLPINEVWTICCRLMQSACEELKIELHAFVLMSNHYHILIRTPECDIDKFMQYFNKKLSTTINKKAGTINHVFGGPYHWSLIKDQAYYLNAIKYVYLNPVRAGICQKVEEYKFSTINSQASIMTKSWSTISLEWLNQVYSDSDSERIRLGLKKKYFVPRAEPKTRRKISIN